MAIDSFIQFKDSKSKAVDGESQDKEYPKWSEVLTWSTGASNPSNPGSGTSGAGSGKVALHGFSFTKYLDSASDDLLKTMCSGEHFASVQLVKRQAGGGEKTQKPYLVIDMGLVFVVGYQMNDNSDDRPTESWSLACGQFGITYKAQKADGTEEGAQPAGWDQVKNIAWKPPGLS